VFPRIIVVGVVKLAMLPLQMAEQRLAALPRVHLQKYHNDFP
jgi:hypothetical protein